MILISILFLSHLNSEFEVNPFLCGPNPLQFPAQFERNQLCLMGMFSPRFKMGNIMQQSETIYLFFAAKKLIKFNCMVGSPFAKLSLQNHLLMACSVSEYFISVFKLTIVTKNSMGNDPREPNRQQCFLPQRTKQKMP